jgi:NAD(P)H-nitrite reductase large subunit
MEGKQKKMSWKISEFLNLLKEYDEDKINEYLNNQVRDSEDMSDDEIIELFSSQIISDKEELKPKLLDALYSDEYGEDAKDIIVSLACGALEKDEKEELINQEDRIKLSRICLDRTYKINGRCGKVFKFRAV